MENNWYVYKHIRLDNNQPFYIGIGNKKKYFRAYEKNKRNNYWKNIYKKTNFLVEIVYDKLSKIEASKKEIELILLYGRTDTNSGILCNLTDGGDGIWNCKRSDETKEKLRLGKLGNKNPQFGKKQSKEVVEKRLVKIRGHKMTDERKHKHSLATIKSGQAKETIVIDYKNGVELGVFHSISEACRYVGLNPIKHCGKASMVANGKRKQVKGYSFKFKTYKSLLL
jgi:hypothetical protein